MNDALKTLLTGLLSSKKAAALLVGLVATLLQVPLIQWLDMPQEEAVALATKVSTQIVALIGAYMIGQGVADVNKGKLPKVAGGAAVGALLCAGLLFLPGCSTQSAYVAADRETYEAIAPEYRAYVEADPKLTPKQKGRRERSVESWGGRLTEAESGDK